MKNRLTYRRHGTERSLMALCLIALVCNVARLQKQTPLASQPVSQSSFLQRLTYTPNGNESAVDRQKLTEPSASVGHGCAMLCKARFCYFGAKLVANRWRCCALSRWFAR
uniref:Putative secreted protein n=1 Tax=Anopheles marajoara TaxID=58244 RepID=A0A2M4C8Y4_9DIPT